MADLPRVLIVEDSPSLGRTYLEFITGEAVEPRLVDSGREAITLIESWQPRVIVLDLRLPDIDGMDILKAATASPRPIAVIIVTAHGSVQLAVDAMRFGAFEFLVKPFAKERLIAAIRTALADEPPARGLTPGLPKGPAIDQDHDFCGMIGRCDAMRRLYTTIAGVARSGAPVLIVGESGTGKELCADAVHKLSPRAGKPFLALNCAAIPTGLMESEIFGHTRGAFTGASADRQGAALAANGGTLFLDEIAELDIRLQSKLLRFFQTGEVQRVGASKIERADVRLVAATNRNPYAEVAAGRLREDLLYRMNTTQITMPPLRERGEDVLLIADFFLQKFSREEGRPPMLLTAEARAALKAYHWPGNIRQLQNVMRQLAVLHGAAAVTADDLPPPLNILAGSMEQAFLPPLREDPADWGGAPKPPAPKVPEQEIRPLAEVEREAIERAIALCDGNIPRAAIALGVSPSTIYRKKQAWDQADGSR